MADRTVVTARARSPRHGLRVSPAAKGPPTEGTLAGGVLPHLEGLRAVAALMVLLFHAQTHWTDGGFGFSVPGLGAFKVTWVLLMGYFGVTLFFVLSGFLLPLPWFRAWRDGRPTPRLGGYLKRRAWRILPAYWVWFALVTWLWMPTFVPHSVLQPGSGLTGWLFHAFLARGYYPTPGQDFMVYTVTWTLTIEVTFYLLVPLLVHAFRGRRWMVSLPLSLALGLGWSAADRLVPLAWVHRVPGLGGLSAAGFVGYADQWIPAVFGAFGLGITGARLWASYERWHLTAPEAARRRVRAWASLAAVTATGAAVAAAATFGYLGVHAGGLGLLVDDPHHWPWLRWFYDIGKPTIFAVLFAVVVVSFGMAHRWVAAPLTCRPARFLGMVSYSSYLWHYPLLLYIATWPALSNLRGGARVMATAATVFAAATAVSTVSYLVVERPALRISHRLRNRATREPGTPLATGAPARPAASVDSAPQEGSIPTR